MGPWGTHNPCARGKAVSMPKGTQGQSGSGPCAVSQLGKWGLGKQRQGALYCGSRDRVCGIVGAEIGAQIISGIEIRMQE